jgi:hypothetical protein
LFCHLHQECEDKDMVDFTRADSDDLAADAPADAEEADDQPDTTADDQPDAESADDSPEEAVDMPVDDIDQVSRKEGQES